MDAWTSYTTFAKLMLRLFEFLDRFHLKHRDEQLLGDRALSIVNTECILDSQVLEPLRKEIIDKFRQDRNRNVIDRYLLRKVTDVFVDMGQKLTRPMKGDTTYYWAGDRCLDQYNKHFEAILLQKCSDEYGIKAQTWLAENNVPAYLKLVDEAHIHEEMICNDLLEPESKPKYLDCIDKQLIASRQDEIIDHETGCLFMILNKRYDELQLMYKCFKRNPENL